MRWRLLQALNLLVVKVLKVRYFKDKDFLEAKVGYCQSFIWRNLIGGRKILQQGLHYRIRKGDKIYVYKSN